MHSAAVFLLLVSLAAASDRPQITSSGGNLYIEASDGKNIEFRPGGRGQIKVGEHDLLQLTGQFSTVSATLQGIRQSLELNVSRVAEQLRNLQGGLSLHTSEFQQLGIRNLPYTVSNLARQLASMGQNVQALRNRLGSTESNVNSIQNQIRQMEQVLATNPCESNPCSHGGSCLTHYTLSGDQHVAAGYRCLCTDAWTGPDCTVDKDECAYFRRYTVVYGKKHSSDCVHGNCVNRVGTYDCACNSGYYGTRCDLPQDTCGTDQLAMCGYGGVCVSKGDGHVCICHDGFDNEDQGQRNSKCVRRPCQTNTCWRQGTFRAQCIERPEPPYYTCQCPKGFHGSGEDCEDIDECIDYQSSACPTGHYCINNIGGFECRCGYGHRLDANGTCVFMGGCSWNPCGPYQRCTPQGRYTYSCACLEGWTASATGGCQQSNQTEAFANCTRLNSCNNGTCMPDDENGYRCNCKTGYTGPNCLDLVPCPDSSYCLNGGTCTFNQYGMRCACPPVYSGRRCNRRNNPCGGVRSDSSGVIRFDPSVYSELHDSSCQWEIRAPPEYSITLAFTKFKLRQSTNCQDEYLQIDNAAKYCSVRSNFVLESQYSNVSLYLKKFSMQDNTTELVVRYFLKSPPLLTDCKAGKVGNLVANAGSIRIPSSNWPSNGTATCTLRLFMPEFDSRSETVFAVTGQLDDRVTCDSADSDMLSLAFYDSNSEGAQPVLQRSSSSCDSNKRVGLDVTGVYFETMLTARLAILPGTSVRSQSTFQIDWRPLYNCSAFESSHESSHGVLHFTAATAHCSQSIVYPLELPFILKIRQTSEGTGKYICLVVRASAVVSQEHRSFGCYDNGETVGPFFPAMLGSGDIRVSNWRSRGDFEVEWQPINCSFTINAISTQWATHNAPEWTATDGDAHELLHCNYLVQAADGYQVEISMAPVTMEGSCDVNYMQIGMTVANDTIRETFEHYKLCTQVEALNITSTMSGKLSIVLHGKPGQVSGFNGFKYRVRDCGGTVVLPVHYSQAVLRYPDRIVSNSQGYRPGVVCEWQAVALQAGDGPTVIYMGSAAFRMAPPEEGLCLADSLTVRSDGDNSTQTYCGDHGPPGITYRSGRLTVQFRAALTGPLAGREGFELRLVATPPWSLELQATTEEKTIGLDKFQSNRIVRLYAMRRTQFIMLNVTALATVSSQRTCVLFLYHSGSRTCIRPINKVYSTSASYVYLVVRQPLPYVRRLFVTYRAEDAQACNILLDLWLEGRTSAAIMPSLMNNFVPAEMQLCRSRLIIPSGNRLNVTSEIQCPMSENGRNLPVVRLSERMGRERVPLAWLPCSQPGQRLSTIFSGDDFYIDYVKPAGLESPLVKLYISASIDCHITLTDTRGRIQSPANGPCRWEVRPQLAFAMQLSVDPTAYSNELQNGQTNCTGSAKITDSQGQVLYEEIDCRPLTNISSGISTTANSISVEWNYARGRQNYGAVHKFQLTYDGHPCSRTMTRSWDAIQYPAGDELQSCEWQIEVEPGYQIEWTADIQMGNIQTRQAYLGVWEGTRLPSDASVAEEAEWKFTGTTRKSGRTTGSFLYVLFYADIGRLQGIPVSFRLTYTSQHSTVCGGHYQRPTGRFASHRDFGHERYPKNTDCAWVISSDPHHYLNLTFDKFNTPSDGNDYMMTYNSWNSQVGFDVAWPSNRNITSGQTVLSGQIKGSPQLPLQYSSKKNVMMKTIFVTDGNQNGEDPTQSGFSAIFEQECGGELTAGSQLQVIESPKDQERLCKWTILAGDDQTDASILLYFSQVHCRFINLIVNYTYDTQIIERRICSLDYDSNIESQDLAFTASRAEVIYRAITPTFLISSASGFVLHYGIAEASCDFDFSKTFSGYIQSYPNMESISPTEPFFCQWKLEAGNGWIIRLEVIFLNIEGTSDCADNYLEMRQQNSTSSEVTRRLCTATYSETERVFWSERIYLKQRRAPISNPRVFQFKLKFTRQPFVQPSASRGVLTSPLYPGSYMSSQDFRWQLTVGRQQIVQFTVEHFQLEPRCFDFIEIRETNSNKRYCLRGYDGTEIPDSKVFYSSTPNVQFRFHADVSIDHYSGFKIQWMAVSRTHLSVTGAAD